jgi:predicted porin
MKKNILAVAIAGAMATPFAANASAPTLYGQMNVAIDSVTDQGSYFANRNSRLGVKGSEDIGNGLKVVYQLETTLAISSEGNDGAGEKNFGANGATDASGFGKLRNTFVGVSGGFGTVVAGRHDTPLRMIQPSDGFNDNFYLGNNTGRFGGLGSKSGEDRLDNMVAYMSPNFNGFQVMLGGVTTAEENADDRELGNAYSASIQYGSKRNGLYAAVGLTQVTDKFESKERQNTRATVQYADAGLVVSAMYNGVTEKSTSDDNSFTLAAAYTMGDFTPRAKVAIVDYARNSTVVGENNRKDATNYAIGLDYALGKKTRTFVEYGVLDKYNGSRADGIDRGDKSTDVFTVGIAHAF